MKYAIRLVTKDGRDFTSDFLEDADLPLSLGTHELMTLAVRTPQGPKQVVISAKVEKWPRGRR